MTILGIPYTNPVCDITNYDTCHLIRTEQRENFKLKLWCQYFLNKNHK